MKDKRRISQSEGIKNQYNELVQKILANELKPKIVEETDTTIIIITRGFYEHAVYKLVWAFNSLTVQYTIWSNIIGNHSFELVFRGNKTQEQIYDDIVDRIDKINQIII